MLWIGFQPQRRVVLSGVVAGHEDLLVGFAIAVGVLHPPQFWGLGHESSTMGQMDGTRHHEMVGKNCAGIHAAIAIGVSEDDDGTSGIGFTPRLLVGHVANHFHHPKPPLGIKLHRHGRMNERFSGHDLRRETGRQSEGSNLVSR